MERAKGKKTVLVGHSDILEDSGTNRVNKFIRAQSAIETPSIPITSAVGSGNNMECRRATRYANNLEVQSEIELQMSMSSGLDTDLGNMELSVLAFGDRTRDALESSCNSDWNVFVWFSSVYRLASILMIRSISYISVYRLACILMIKSIFYC